MNIITLIFILKNHNNKILCVLCTDVINDAVCSSYIATKLKNLTPVI